jgi:hypothetical protein
MGHKKQKEHIKYSFLVKRTFFCCEKLCEKGKMWKSLESSSILNIEHSNILNVSVSMLHHHKTFTKKNFLLKDCGYETHSLHKHLPMDSWLHCFSPLTSAKLTPQSLSFPHSKRGVNNGPQNGRKGGNMLNNS